MENKIRLMRILNLTHRDASGCEKFKKNYILNSLHLIGQRFMLEVLFSGKDLPVNYYMGLDSRDSISEEDVIADIVGLEPSSNGYARQSVRSDSFSLSLNSASFWQANGPTVVFSATEGSWGPIRNIFLSTALDESATLISSASIGQTLTVLAGESITMRMAMSLSGC